MGMIKKESTAVNPGAPLPGTIAPAAETAKQDNGTAAAVSRLQKKTETTSAKAAAPAGRDFDKEARGKTRCVQFEAALMSPAIAGMKFDTMDQYLALCKQAADFGTKYTFGE